MDNLRTCIDCGNEYKPGSSNAKRCRDCAAKARRLSSRHPGIPKQKCTVCDELFQPYRTGQVTCGSPVCQRKRFNDKRAATPGDTPFLVQARLQEERLEGARENRFEALANSLGTYKPVRFNPPKGLKEDPAHSAWILHLSDWHIGQQTTAEATGGLYYHDHEVALAQLEKMAATQRELLRDSGRVIQRVLVIVNGDIIDGDDMRPSQHRDIEFLVTEQAVKAFELLCWMIDALLGMVPEVLVSNVGGNHDRTSRKAGNAGLGELGYKDTFSWLNGELLKARYSTEPRVSVRNSASFFSNFVFEGFKVVHSHGSDVRWGSGAYGGVPWYPIVNAANKYSQMLGGYDFLFMAHGHTPAVLPIGESGYLFMNGSLPGTSTYVQASFKSVRRPVQQLVTINRHGVVAYNPLYLEVGQMAPAQWS